jgi:glutathione S-transferase
MSYVFYWSPSMASFVAHMCLDEAGVAYDGKKLDFEKEEQKSPAYLKINPLGKVPALVVDGTVLTESAAICMFVADANPDSKLAPKVGSLARGRYYMWLTYLTNTLQPTLSRTYYPERATADPAGAAGVLASAKADAAAIWQRIDRHLTENGPYLLGNLFSAADLFVFMLSTWQHPGDDLYRRCPGVAGHAESIKARTLIRKTLVANGIA